MPLIDLSLETQISRSPRARQVEALFDLPPSEKARQHWEGDVPLERREWNVGLIVGASGSGKSSVARELFGAHMHPTLEWRGKSVIDDFPSHLGIEAITAACSSVGFNTMPAWLRSYSVLSNGERFRVDLARRLLELPDPVVVDEFTSVVDRQVAQIGSHAVQKFVRRQKKKFVAVSCHYDIEEWLQPDWVLEPATMTFRWRSLQRRPSVAIEIQRVSHASWHIFAPFHYLTSSLNSASRCYALFVGERPAAFVGVLHFPHPHINNMKKFSRVVTLPDWQGLGLAFVLMDTVASAYKHMGCRVRINPAHPSFVRSFDRHRYWKLAAKPGASMVTLTHESTRKGMRLQRPCASFEYIGPRMQDRLEARRLLQM